MKKIVVFGCFLVDLTARTPHFPNPGETVLGSSFVLGPGGKGFNQAVAAHKAGANVIMVTKLGRDTFASVALDTMLALGMDDSHIFYSESISTGAALIMVDEATGQNEIVAISGACGAITEEEVGSLRNLLKGSHILLVQLESNLDATWQVIRMAKELGLTVVLNTAPAGYVPNEILALVDIVTPNEVEAELINGIPVNSVETAEQSAHWFLGKGVRQVVITLGSRGCYVHDGISGLLLPARAVNAIDTTGAGDAFNGGLVAALSEGKSLREAAAFATVVASLSVQRVGTTPSMPTRAEIDESMCSNK